MRKQLKLNQRVIIMSDTTFDAGTVGNVVMSDSEYVPKIQTDSGKYNYAANHEVEPYTPPTLVVTVGGRQTTAKMLCNRKVLAIGTAICAPDDTFNPFIGMQIAVARLMDELHVKQVVAPQMLQQLADGDATLIDYLSYKDKK